MRKFLMITSAILGLGCLSPFTIKAQTCTAAPSCADMGYTKTASDCTGKTTLKCPFDLTKVSCEDGDGSSGSGEWDWDNAVQCQQLDYTETKINSYNHYILQIPYDGWLYFSGDSNYANYFEVIDSLNVIKASMTYPLSITIFVKENYSVQIRDYFANRICYFIPVKAH